MPKIIILFYCFVLSSSCFSQKLNKAKESLKKKDLSVEIEKQHTSTQNNGEEGSFKEELFYEFVIKPVVFLAKAATYELLIQSIFEEKKHHPWMELTPHPYLDTLRGDYTFDSETSKPIRFDIFNQFLFDGHHTSGNNLNAKFRFLQRGSIEYNQLYLLENKNETSQFFAHDITANYYRIRTQCFSLHYGLGATFVHSGINRAYFSYKTGIEYFFKLPISISLEHSGTPINENGISQTKASINIFKKKYAFSSGLQFYKIGAVDYRMFAVGGKIYL